MSNVKFMEKLEKLDTLLRQFPHGVSAVKLAEKMGVSRTGVYDFLNSLESRGKARSEHGLWYPQQSGQNGFQTQEQQFERELSADRKRIKEDYINGRIEQAYRRTILLVKRGNVSKEWLEKNQILLKSLNTEQQAMAKNSIERYNPQRRVRICKLKTEIVVKALEQWE